MNKELISVIVPIYNSEEYLEKCINSILNQTYKNLEVILIDDGSNDNSGKICDKYKEIDNRIVIVHQLNKGLSSARNKGLSISKGKLIGFVDSDDYLEINMFEELKKNMDIYNSDIVICDFYRIKNGKKIQKKFKYDNNSFVSYDKEKFNNIQNRYSSLTVVAWNKLYKKEIFDNIKYPEGKIFEDSYIICDLLDKSNKVSYVLKPLYNYVYRNNSIINTFNINHFNETESHKKKALFFYKKGYYDLAKKEKSKITNNILLNLAKMKRYKIKNEEIEKKYYKELVRTNKEVKWKDATKINKFYKVFRKSSITILAFGLKIRDIIRK